MNNENSVIDGMQFSNGRWLASNISPSRHSHDNGSSLKPGSGDGGGGERWRYVGSSCCET